MRHALCLFLFASLLFISPSQRSAGQFSGLIPPIPGLDGDPKLEPFDKVVKGAKEYDGMFKLYHKGENVYAEVRPDQFDKPFLLPIAVARGGGLGGFTLNFDEQWVLMFRKVGDSKVHLVRRNVRFKANPSSPVAKAVETTYTDSVLLALKVHSIHPGRQSLLINLNDIFMHDFAELGLGFFDSQRSTWHKIKTYPRNIELQVAATYSARRGLFSAVGGGGDGSVIDNRGNTVVIHYGFVQLPEDGYQPRYADDRIGYFLSAVKDFSSDSKDTSFLRYVNRWRLERADGDPKNKDKLSVPKKKIVYWIEKSVPFEYRAFVREGILEWNKAFEKIGFRDAIEVRQQESEDFDPEDMNYNTFRWITMGAGFAMGPSRANPLTGEILDADIIFDADLVRFWKQEAKVFTGNTATAEPASKIQALRYGYGLPPPPGGKVGMGWDDRKIGPQAEALESQTDRLWAIKQGVCQCGSCMKQELGLMAMALAVRDQGKGSSAIPDELIGQAIKYVVMHEVGHTLGLRHNFKGSAMLKNEDLHDTAITRKQGLSASVMDYLPANIAPKGTKQGDYFTTTLGPYDYWAIEYAYAPMTGGTEGELEKLREIASRGAKLEHDYGTDEDMFGTSDPLINAFDLGADPMKFGMDRMLLAEELLKNLPDKLIDKGDGYQRLRLAFNMILRQYGDAAFMTALFVGGEYAHRDHRGDADARDPLVPVKAAKQRQALKFLQEHLLTDKHFKFPPAMLRKLAADRWSHWGNEGDFSVEFPVHDRILDIQKLVLTQLLNAGTLRRIQDTALKTEDEQPLQISEVFRTLTDGVWSDYPLKSPGEKKAQSSSPLKRNLQREHFKELSNLVLGKRGGEGNFIFIGGGATVPPDARSLARLHLREIETRIATALKDNQAGMEETTRAHLEELRERIQKVLSASIQTGGN